MHDSPNIEDLISRIEKLEIENTNYRQQLNEFLRIEQKFRMMIENVPDLIWSISIDKMQVNYLNPSVESVLGYSKQEALEKKFTQILTPDSYDAVMRYFKEVIYPLKHGQKSIPEVHSIEIEYICKDGRVLPFEVTVKPMFDEHGVPVEVIGVSRDISKRIEFQNALKKSEKKYRSLFEASRDAIYISSKEGKFIEMNPAGVEMFGYTFDEIIGLDVYKIYNDPGDREKFQNVIEQNGYVRDYEIKLLKKDGSKMDCLLTATLWRSHEGSLIGYQGIIRDITSQKRLFEQLQQSQKMEAIGTLAGGIAHNFNNLLMTIQGNTSLMLMKTKPDDPHYKKLKTIEQHIQYGSELSRQLLGFARGGQNQLKTLNLNHLIRMGSKMFATTRKEISIKTTFEENIWPVEVDPAQIEQVMLNLFVNAGQAMPGGGEIFIKTENIHLGEKEVSPYQTAPGRYIKLSVTDTGVGMDSKTRQKIFEPFFTTKEQGVGTGLGLSTVYGIIKNHKGHISVYSEPGKGTTFNIYLPASGQTPELETARFSNLLRGNETILVIEDEKMIVDIATAMLTELGYKVLTANSAYESLAVYQSNMKVIDLVILDLIIPKMGGDQIFKELKKVNPQIKVLLSSGYSLDGKAEVLLSMGCKGFIQKPYNLFELSKKIREVIDK